MKAEVGDAESFTVILKGLCDPFLGSILQEGLLIRAGKERSLKLTFLL
jgi:hypothetical protein